MQFSKTTMLPSTLLELFMVWKVWSWTSTPSLASTVNTYAHHWTTLWPVLETKSEDQGCSSRRMVENSVTDNSCTNQLKEGLWLYWRQKVVQHHINKELWTVSAVSLLLCSAPVQYMRHVTWGPRNRTVLRSTTASPLVTVLSRSVGRVKCCWPSPTSEVHILKLVLSRSIGYIAAGLHQQSQSWLRAPTFLFFARRFSVLKWGLLFDDRMGEPRAGTHSLSGPLPTRALRFQSWELSL
jgi:hypothetical protein